jgi:hydrogenase maturation protease
MTASAETVLIVGTGNELLGDEGLGIHVVRSLVARTSLPAHVEVIEAGTALLDLLPEMARCSRVILIDAIRAGGEPGTLYRLEIVAGSVLQTDTSLPVSLHQWGILETLRSAEMLDLMPQQLTLLGAEPESVELGLELSPRLTKAAEKIVAILLQEARLGDGLRRIDVAEVARASRLRVD